MQGFTKFHIEISKCITTFQNPFLQQNIHITVLFCLLPHTVIVRPMRWYKTFMYVDTTKHNNSCRIYGIIQQGIQSKETPNQPIILKQFSIRHWLPCFKTSLQSKHSGTQQHTPEAGKWMATKRKVMIQWEPGSRAQAMQRHLMLSWRQVIIQAGTCFFSSQRCKMQPQLGSEGGRIHQQTHCDYSQVQLLQLISACSLNHISNISGRQHSKNSVIACTDCP